VAVDGCGEIGVLRFSDEISGDVEAALGNGALRKVEEGESAGQERRVGNARCELLAITSARVAEEVEAEAKVTHRGFVEGASRAHPVHLMLARGDGGVGSNCGGIDKRLVQCPDEAVERRCRRDGSQPDGCGSLEKPSPVHVGSVSVIEGIRCLLWTKAESIFGGSVHLAKQLSVQLMGPLQASLPLGDHGGIDAEALSIVLPREGGQRLGNLSLREAEPGPLGLQVNVR